MSDRQAPTAERFAVQVRQKMDTEGRKWAWLSRETGIPAATLRNQLDKPHTLLLGTARAISVALDMPLAGEEAA